MKETVQPDGAKGSEALQQLRGAVCAFVLSRVKDPALAEDLTQETLLRLHSNIDRLRRADRLQAWVFRIARNVVADHFRAAKADEPFDEGSHTPAADEQRHQVLVAEEEILRGRLTAYIRSVVEDLPEIYREALQLTEFERLSQVALARRLGLSVSAAKSRVQRARRMVREEIERCCRWETDCYGTVLDCHPRTGHHE